MIIAWGDDLLETTQGLDILGVRSIDQAVEFALVNGITTISQRARYLSILPWALGHYLIDHASEGFDWESLRIYLRRIEFVTLAASKLDSEKNGADASGALGVNLHQDRLAKLINGESVAFPEDRGGAILGTYLGPCRAIGLLLDGDETVPYRLSPRGKEIWEIRRARLRASPVMTAISTGTKFSRDLAEAAIPDFSLGSLSSSGDEAGLLHNALVTPWDPENEVVAKAYERFNETIAWANGMLASRPDNASGLLKRNFRNCIEGEAKTEVAFAWAEYEYRRRCHFALELLLAALTSSLSEFEEASVTQVVSDWFNSFEPSQFLSEIWPDALQAREATAIDGVTSVPGELFVNERIPVTNLQHLAPSNQAFAAVALIASGASQTRMIRRNGHFDRKPLSPGERAVCIVEHAGEKTFIDFMESLVELTALAHLQTTLRKMGAGQKCSLRLFPEGPLLRPTGIGMLPGHSNDRLTNVLRILTDIGELHRKDGRFTPYDSGAQ